MSPDSPRGATMLAEIAEQPEALARLLDDPTPGAIARQIERVRPRFVLLAGRGSSDHAALYAKYLLETRLGLPVGLVSPSTFTVFGARPDLRDVLWLAVSQSGGSPDLVESTARARECGALTVSVTNAPGSPLDEAAALTIPILAGPERSVAATKSYTSELMALYLVIDAWAGGDAVAARPVPDRSAEVIARAEGVAAASRYRFVDRIVVTGRGYAYPTAREAALKLMETSYISAHAFSSADLMHGPLAMIDQDRPVIAVVPHGLGGDAMAPVLQRLADSGADVMVVGDDRLAANPSASIWLPDDVDEQVAPMLQIIPLQQLAATMAVARGYDPDAPRGLRKVTETF